MTSLLDCDVVETLELFLVGLRQSASCKVLCFRGAVKDAAFGIFTTVDEDWSLADCDPDLETLTAGSSSPTPESESLFKA